MTPQPEEPNPSLADVRRWPQRARWAVYGATLLAVVVALGLWDAERGRDVGDGVRVDVPNARRWWAAVAACLGDDAPYPEHVTYYVGSRVPTAWMQRSDLGGTFGAYTEAGTGRIMLAPYAVTDSALVTHELWHVIHGASHPARIFGDATHGPRCGVARP